MEKLTLYALPLTKPNAKISRYALYEIRHKKLEIIWPITFADETKKLWPCQVEYRKTESIQKDKYPIYHFTVGNIGYNKLHFLAQALSEHMSREIEILVLNGWNPSEKEA